MILSISNQTLCDILNPKMTFTEASKEIKPSDIVRITRKLRDGRGDIVDRLSYARFFIITSAEKENINQLALYQAKILLDTYEPQDVLKKLQGAKKGGLLRKFAGVENLEELRKSLAEKNPSYYRVYKTMNIKLIEELEDEMVKALKYR